VAARAEARRHVILPGRKIPLPFSAAVLAGDTLYLAGRIGIDPKTGKAPLSLDEELRLLFQGVRGGPCRSPDISPWEHFNSAYVKCFSRDLPARAFIGSGPLLQNGRFEMMGIAVRKS
jgi:2-iminobutanoate/2-iminopropanoate deaminase